MAVRIVTDSTCDIPPQLVKDLAITVVPCNIHFGQDVLRDGVDIKPPEFYHRLAQSKVLPHTSQPSAGVFAEAYDRLAAETGEVLSIHLASALSGTYNSAVLGRQEMAKKCHVEVIDSQNTSLALGFIVLLAAKAAREGAKLNEIVASVKEAVPRVKCFLLVDTLHYLEKGGRIGKAQSFLGSVLKVKPILLVKDGQVLPFERVRTRAKALDRLAQIITEQKGIVDLGMAHGSCPQDADALAARVRKVTPKGPLMSEITPVLGVHTGPGALGVAIRTER